MINLNYMIKASITLAFIFIIAILTIIPIFFIFALLNVLCSILFYYSINRYKSNNLK